MKTFEILIKENCYRRYVVEAETEDEAEEKFRNWNGENSDELYWDEDFYECEYDSIDEINEVDE